MLKYSLRRILYMIPTVFGIIVLTFILFNVSGGDPAMKKLGQQATAASMEEYDIQRGYDKPLLLGLWGKTRAYRHELTRNAGPWTAIKGVEYKPEPGRLILPSGGEYEVPMACGVPQEERFKWAVIYRTSANAALLTKNGSNVVAKTDLPASAAWAKCKIEFDSGKAGQDHVFTFVSGGAALEIRELRLQKRSEGLFDSQFVFYLHQIATFDFGRSIETNQRVSRMILDGMLPSLSLTVPMFFIALFVEIALALVCAFFRNRFIDRFFVVVSVMLMSLPYLVWIIGGQYILGYLYRFFPVWGYESAYYVILPVIIGVVSGIGGGLRFYRTIMLDEMYRDYVRTAFAKGVGKYGVLFRHVLKNAMIPILTSVVMAIPFLYTGSLLLETFFGIPGLGNLSINAINNSDFDVVRAVVFVGAILFVVANLITDLCYALVDPRVKLE